MADRCASCGAPVIQEMAARFPAREVLGVVHELELLAAQIEQDRSAWGRPRRLAAEQRRLLARLRAALEPERRAALAGRAASV